MKIFDQSQTTLLKVFHSTPFVTWYGVGSAWENRWIFLGTGINIRVSLRHLSIATDNEWQNCRDFLLSADRPRIWVEKREGGGYKSACTRWVIRNMAALSILFLSLWKELRVVFFHMFRYLARASRQILYDFIVYATYSGWLFYRVKASKRSRQNIFSMYSYFDTVHSFMNDQDEDAIWLFWDVIS